MGWTAVRKLREVVANVRTCLAVEVCCAAQGIDLRAEVAAPSDALGAVHAAVRARVPAMIVDREVAEQIASIDGLLPALVEVAGTHGGGLRCRRAPRRARPGRGHRARNGSGPAVQFLQLALDVDEVTLAARRHDLEGSQQEP